MLSMRFSQYARLVLLCLLTLLCSTATRAQESPEATAAAYYAAIETGDWARMAALTHPDELARFRALVIGVVKELPTVPTVPTEEYRYGTLGTTQQEAFDYLRVVSLVHLEQLAPADVFERFLTNTSDVMSGVRSAFTGVENESESDILGSIAEGDSLAHVVRRARFTGERPESHLSQVREWEEGSRMDVLTVKRDGDAWRVLTDTGYAMYLSIRTLLTN